MKRTPGRPVAAMAPKGGETHALRNEQTTLCNRDTTDWYKYDDKFGITCQRCVKRINKRESFVEVQRETKKDVFKAVLDSLEEYMLAEVNDWAINETERAVGREDTRQDIQKLRERYAEAL